MMTETARQNTDSQPRFGVDRQQPQGRAFEIAGKCIKPALFACNVAAVIGCVHVGFWAMAAANVVSLTLIVFCWPE